MKLSRRVAPSLAIVLAAVSAQAEAQTAYQDPGVAGDPASWRTPEFRADWGLGSMKADAAYAKGITGKTVIIGAVDSGALANHPEFQTRYNYLTTSGTYYADGYKYITSRGVITDPWTAGSPFSVPGQRNGSFNDDHGTHVSGTMAAARDGVGMHGVAFNSTIFVTNTFANDGTIYGANQDYNYFKSAYGNLAAAGARVINSSWGSPPPPDNYNTLAGLTAAYRPFVGKLTWLDAVGEVAKQGVVQVFAAGNAGVNNPTVRAALPYFRPDLESTWVSATGLRIDDTTAFNRCGVAKWWCIAGPGVGIFGATSTASGVPGYGNKSGTSMSAPHVSGALALIMERYPYLSGEAARDILLTTAEHLGSGPIDVPNTVFGWGKPNLDRAMNGPGQFLGQFSASLPGGTVDTWSNPISDVALKARFVEDKAEHDAWVANKAARGWTLGLPPGASADDAFAYALGETRDQAYLARQYEGGLTKSGDGTLRLTGASTYTGSTIVNAGLLAVDGSIVSTALVSGRGRLGGVGTVGGLVADAGGTVAPGNSIGTLNVSGNAAFAKGSVFAVEVAPGGASDRLQVGGAATLTGGTVTLSLENAASPLNYAQTRALLGNQYTILSAAGGVTGRFDAATPSFLFIGPNVTYGANAVNLSIARNAISFASVAASRNGLATGTAAEALGLGNPVYEGVLASGSAGEARSAYDRLSGEIHSSAVTSEFETAFFVREAILARLRGSTASPLQGLAFGGVLPAAYAADLPGTRRPLSAVPVAVIDPSVVSLWGQGFGAWGETRGDGNAGRLRRDLMGFIVGADVKLSEQFKLGIAGGYTDSHLDVTSRLSSGDVKSAFGAIYGGAEFGALGLRAGASYAGNDLDIRRTPLGGTTRAKYDGTTGQVFGELGYKLGTELAYLEPFAGAAGIWIRHDGFREEGGFAALSARGQGYDTATSTVGVRGRVSPFAEMPLTLQGSLGWRRAYGDIVPATALSFAGSLSQFTTAGVPIDRDALVAEASLEYRLTQALSVGVGYVGQVGERGQDHQIRGNVAYRF